MFDRDVIHGEVDGGQPEHTDELDAEITHERVLTAHHDQAAVHREQLPAELIGGGTREIQLNIIAQMILGLPRK